MKTNILIIYKSENGRDGWVPVLPESVPAWVKAPDVMGRLVAGEMCMDPRSISLTDWFRAERVLTPQDRAKLQAAQRKRELRQTVSRMVH